MLEWLLGGNFPTRDHCGQWETWLINANVWSDGLIALAYFAIPATLAYFWATHREHVPSGWILLCFATFIALCGLTHLTQVVVFWHAPYRLFTVIKIVTAAASVGTMVLLPPVVRYVKSLPSVESYRRAVAELDAELVSRVQLENDLLARIAELQSAVVSHSVPAPKKGELTAKLESLRALLPRGSGSRLPAANGGAR